MTSRMILALAALAAATLASASPILVRHDLSGLVPGDYLLSFGLVDGSFLGDGDATVSINELSGVGATFGIPEEPLGNAVGNPRSDTLVLTDGPDAVNAAADWATPFTLAVGGRLSFVVDFAGGGENDYFVYRLYRPGYIPVSTEGLFGVESVSALASASGFAPLAAHAGFGSDSSVAAPKLTVVPEPASLAGLALALAAFRRRGSHKVSA